MSNLQVALELRAEVDRFTANLRQATGEFDRALGGMQATAQTTGDRVEQAMQKVGLRRHSEINAEIRSVERAYQTLANSGTLSQRELAQASIAMQDRIRELRGETNGWTQSLGRMKSELAVAGAAIFAATRTFGNAARASSEFQTSLAEISTLDFSGNIEDLRGEIERLSREFGGDVVTNAQAAYQIISAGASDAATAVDLLTEANKLAVGGVTDVSTAATGLTSIMSAYGDAAGGVQNVTDALFVAMRGGRTTIGELSASIGQVSGLASTAGVSLEEMLAAASALTRTAGSTSQAMTQLQGIMAAVIRPTAEATRTAEALGLEFNTAAIRSQGFAAWMEEVREKTGGNEEVLGRLFGRLEGLNGALQLTGESAGVFTQILGDMETKAGETDAAVEKMMDTPAARAARFEQAMAGIQRSLGDAVTALSPLLEGLTNLANRFNEMDPTTRTVIAGFAGVVGATALLLPALASVIRAVRLVHLGYLAAAGSTGAATGAFAVNAGAATAASGAIGILARALRRLPWIAVAAAAAELTSEIINLRNAHKDLAEAQDALLEGAVSLQERLVEVSETTGLAFASMEEFRAAVAAGNVVFDEATGQWYAAAEAQAELAEATEDATAAAGQQADATRDHWQALLDTAQAAGRLAAGLAEIDPAAEGAAAAVDELLAGLDLANQADLRVVTMALEDLGDQAEGTADLVQDRLLEAVREADGTTLQGLIKQLNDVRAAGETASTTLEALAGEALRESFRRLGLSIDQELGKIGPASQRAIEALDGILAGIGGLGMGAQQQSDTIERALTAAFASADTDAAIDALGERLEQSRRQGLLTSAAYERMAAALAALRNEADKTEPPIKKLGNEHERTAQSTERHGEATAEAAEKMKAAISVGISWASALQRAGFAAEEAARYTEIMGQAYESARNQALEGVRTYREYLRALAGAKEEAIRTTDAIRRLDNQLRRMDDSTSSAAQRTRDLELQLLELNGTEEQVAQARAQREREQVQLAIERNRLLAERARLAGDETAAAAYRAENAELQRQLQLMDQIAQAEARRSQEQAARQAETAGGSSQAAASSGSSGAVGGDRRVTIALENGPSATVPESSERDVLALIEEAIRRAR